MANDGAPRGCLPAEDALPDNPSGVPEAKISPGRPVMTLVIGHWAFIGYWSLVIGHYPGVMHDTLSTALETLGAVSVFCFQLGRNVPQCFADSDERGNRKPLGIIPPIFHRAGEAWLTPVLGVSTLPAMSIALYPFMVLAAIGLLLSLGVHIMALAGLPIPGGGTVW